jgi:NAD(P)H-dependent FMN reductase
MRIVLVTGSTRPGSTNTAALRTMQSLAPPEVDADLYDGLIDLPAFVPGADGDAAVADLRARLAAADAVLFCTPEYAGTLPGSLKNLLDWTVGSGELYRKPVAWVTVAAQGRGAGAEATLAAVLSYVDAVVLADACAHIPVARDDIGADGLVVSPAAGQALLAVLNQLKSSRTTR